MTDQTPKPCECGLATRLVGDGCEVCNPALALEYAKETITSLRAEVERLRDVVIAGSCISRLDQVCVCWSGGQCREAAAILAARQSARGEKP